MSAASASWVYLFVVYDGNVYSITQEHVDPGQIGSRIGKVTKYSDVEGTYSGNFSNRYAKGTPYYEIKGINRKEAIAVKESDSSYVKAIYEHEYGGNKTSWEDYVPYAIVIAAALLLLLLFYIRKGSRQ